MKFTLSWKGLLPILLMVAALAWPSAVTGQQYRTVIDKELGSIYQQPNGFPFSAYGILEGPYANSLDPTAIRVLMAHFQHFAPAEDTQARGFAYSSLRAYEAQQVAQGRPSIFVTATYEGKSRPVLFSWSLGLQNGKPTIPSSQWQYAVNVQDPRYIHFWINHFMQSLVAKYQNWPGAGPNLAFHLDQCSFVYSLYGVLDDNNNFVAGIPWDRPFPQNQTEFEAAIETFFSQVKRLSPNLILLPNIGSLPDPSHFPQVYADVEGGLTEDLLGWYPKPSAFTRSQWYTGLFQYFSWMASHNRIMNLRALVPSGDPNALPTAFVVYSLLKGPNSFFAAGDTHGNTLNPSQWASMKAALGQPSSDLQVSQPTTAGSGYRLFWRNFEGGVVYLNWTGNTQTIPLDSQHIYFDPAGNRVTQIQVPDGVGTYLMTALNRLPPPRIAPRYSLPALGPIFVTMESDTPGSSVHYTLDGTVPTQSSPAYTGPIQVNSSVVVHAISSEGNSFSLPSVASYVIPSSSAPVVQFSLESDNGPAGTYYPVLALDGVPSAPVTITYTVQNGSPRTGSYTFPPGMAYGILPLTTALNGITTISITGVSGAAVGSRSILHYNAVDVSTGADFSLASSPNTATINAGQSAQFSLNVAPIEGFSQSIHFTCATVSSITCSLSPTSVTLDGVHHATIAVSAQSLNRVAGHTAPSPAPFGYLAAFMCTALVAHDRRRLWGMIAVFALTLGVLTACSTGGSTLFSRPAGSQSYNLTITGTSGSLAHATAIALTVK